MWKKPLVTFPQRVISGQLALVLSVFELILFLACNWDFLCLLAYGHLLFLLPNFSSSEDENKNKKASNKPLCSSYPGQQHTADLHS